jgi:hypothetical protein
MADQQQTQSPFGDPSQWKSQFDEAVRQWNEFLTSMMGTEAFAPRTAALWTRSWTCSG